MRFSGCRETRRRTKPGPCVPETPFPPLRPALQVADFDHLVVATRHDAIARPTTMPRLAHVPHHDRLAFRD